MTHAVKHGYGHGERRTFAEPLLSDQEGNARVRSMELLEVTQGSAGAGGGRSMEILQEVQKRPQRKRMDLSQ